MATEQHEGYNLGLGDLPECCIAAILRLTTPADVARLACISRVFRDASYADLVWEAMLPPHCTDVLQKASDAPPSTCSKKEVYNYLSNRVLLENGDQDYWIHRATGGVCRSIGARGLVVAGGDDTRWWTWCTRKDSRFPEVVYLKAICWLEVQGRLRSFFPRGTYTVSWRLYSNDLSLRRRGHYSSFGWTGPNPVEFSLRTSENQHIRKDIYLTRARGLYAQEGVGHAPMLKTPSVHGTWMDHGTWLEVHAGDFIVENGDVPIELQFSLREVVGGKWKGGLSIDGVVIRPSN